LWIAAGNVFGENKGRRFVWKVCERINEDKSQKTNHKSQWMVLSLKFGACDLKFGTWSLKELKFLAYTPLVSL
jgi:hypothetical protein